MHNETIYISPSLNKHDTSEIITNLKNDFDIKIGTSTDDDSESIFVTYITDTYDDCKKLKFCKIILLLANPDELKKLNSCSITSISVNEIVDYLKLKNYHLGLTYCTVSSINIYELHKMLRSWTIKHGIPEKVDYLYQTVGDQLFNNTTCVLRNVVDIGSIKYIVNKDELYHCMQQTYHDYLLFMPETTRLDDLIKIKPNEVYIVRPVGPEANDKKGIVKITDTEQLEREKKIIKIHKQWKWIASRYITNPLTIQGRKCHFRCYLMVSSINKFYKFQIYQIFLAKDKYQATNYYDNSIHDTNLLWAQYPRDFNDPKIRDGVDFIMEKIIGAVSKPIMSLVTDKYAYQILAIDIMFDDDYHPWLIKISPNVNYLNDKDFEKAFLSWEYNTIIKQIFTKIKLVAMEQITNKQIDELLEITQNRDIMENIARGELWNRNKILEIVSESKADANIQITNRKYFNWVVCLKYGIQKVVGYVGLRPMSQQKNLNIGPKDLQIRIFTYPSQGYGTAIIKELIKFIETTPFNLWATIHVDNKISINFFQNLGWKKIGLIKLGGIDNVVMMYEKKLII